LPCGSTFGISVGRAARSTPPLLGWVAGVVGAGPEATDPPTLVGLAAGAPPPASGMASHAVSTATAVPLSSSCSAVRRETLSVLEGVFATIFVCPLN
jgi:hypothetical protein